jgi:activator of 2-hydroxyglutaryl-CoA dehydratase/predicted nucleotide-binding protein (sugar kinase/HSP70/actin superfamily)
MEYFMQFIFIDAGVHSIKCEIYDDKLHLLQQFHIPSSENLQQSLKEYNLLNLPQDTTVYITGKLQNTIKRHIPNAILILSSAALWAAAKELRDKNSLAILEISASGYMAIGINQDGSLKDDLLITNPRCGAGSGVNLDRVLQKLDIAKEDVDDVLKNYCYEANKEDREELHIRADRCGVFASSATISDKNQGIPIDYALAITLKSEVLKACKKITTHFDTIYLTGGLFAWQFAKDCASDYFKSIGIDDIEYDDKQNIPLVGLKSLHKQIGAKNFAQPDSRVAKDSKLIEYPSMNKIKKELIDKNLFLRIEEDINNPSNINQLKTKDVILGLDVGSTMAKLIITDKSGNHILYKGSFSNAGDTIDTIKEIFKTLKKQGIEELNILQIGLTGSARYQVKKSMQSVYPKLADRLTALVENYAHAQGSIDYAKEHIKRLKSQGIKDINEDFCLLVDIGGEDTKISSIALGKGELYDNAMNVKCSAGTGSLMDTLSSMFYIDSISKACDMAQNANKGYVINATCAVFLMENARKLQAQGYGKDEILASANWAIVENMARTLWNQIELPKHTVTLLHGQTMLSDPLPIAVAHRLQSYIQAPTYTLIPPHPGHRACLGLTKSLTQLDTQSAITIKLDEYINKQYTKKIIKCQGVACGDAMAQCNRSRLTSTTEDGKRFGFSLGGCTAINELQSTKGMKIPGKKDTYKQIWEFIDDKLPHSDDENRLIIPRSFVVSEWAMFFASLFMPFGIKVDTDNVIESDIINAQQHFHIDTCAPHIGVVGQFLRLASKPHGMILAPQIKFLPTNKGKSLGRTCTINQGGFAVAKEIAKSHYSDANIHLFYLDLKTNSSKKLAQKLYFRLKDIYKYYDIDLEFEEFYKVVQNALQAQQQLKTQAADYATQLAQKALNDGKETALVMGREYILNPGIYDSHVGRLLRDKNMAGIPSYLLDIDYNPKFKHLYWRNPHLLATIADAATKKTLHKIINHKGLKEIFEQIENQSNSIIPVVQVSTFLCGPDSVTNPLISELTKQRPFLLIQSDAVIKELAHLENRMNTYVKQLKSGLYKEIDEFSKDGFEIEVLDRFTNKTKLNPDTDVIYFPTLSDNRMLTSVIRAAGFECVDLYSDDYSLEDAIKDGRGVAGDLVCAPLAAVYGDVLSAIRDFKQKKAKDSTTYANKKRLLIFNNKGLGPCRQGQYVETHKIFLNQAQSSQENSEDFITQFLVAHENKGFNTGFEQWVFIRGVQSVILQGVLHQILADGAMSCHSYDEYVEFMNAYKNLKTELFDILENIAPSKLASSIVKKTNKIPLISHIVKYFAYGYYKNPLKQPLREFTKKWCKQTPTEDITKIHIDGEAYMRIAQYEDIHKTLLATLGFGQFYLTHTPLWSFLDYKLAGMLMRAKEAIDETTKEIAIEDNKDEIKKLKKYRFTKQKRLWGLKAIHYALRNILAKPLYDAANISMPEPMPEILEHAKSVIETKRPGGELVPYVGEALKKLEENYDLVINVAPEGCMVSAMGEAITPGIYNATKSKKGNIQHLFSQQGDVDTELIQVALLKTIGATRFYKKIYT